MPRPYQDLDVCLGPPLWPGSSVQLHALFLIRAFGTLRKEMGELGHPFSVCMTSSFFSFLKKRNLNRFSYLRQALETLQGIHSSFVPKATQRGGRKGAGDLSHPMEDVLRLTKRKIGLSLIRKMKVKPKIFRGIKSLPRPHFHALRVHQKNKGNK